MKHHGNPMNMCVHKSAISRTSHHKWAGRFESTESLKLASRSGISEAPSQHKGGKGQILHGMCDMKLLHVHKIGF
jgi:hypothetical protein